VLDSVPGLTPGDFVRSVKQLIDLLDQIAAAASFDAKGNAAARAKTRPVPPEESDLSLPPETANAAAGTATRPAAAGDRARSLAPPAADAEGDAENPAPPVAGDGQVPSREPAPRQRDVAATARAAIDAMRRGVIAYTNVAV